MEVVERIVLVEIEESGRVVVALNEIAVGFLSNDESLFVVLLMSGCWLNENVGSFGGLLVFVLNEKDWNRLGFSAGTCEKRWFWYISRRFMPSLSFIKQSLNYSGL